MIEVQALLDTALEAARRGGEVVLDRYQSVREVSFKSGRTDLVTDADRASEALIAKVIRERHPDHALLAEEGTRAASEGGHRWIVDPLDGTVNYAHRIPFFCVSVAVEDGSGLLAGVICDPIHGETFAAARGRGATLNGAPIQVSGTAALADAMVATGFAYDLESRAQNLPLFERFLPGTRGLRRLGSAALDLAYVACGRFDGFWELGLKPWDLAAGALLVREAGGVVTGFQEDEAPLVTGRIIAAGPALHPIMRRVIAGGPT